MTVRGAAMAALAGALCVAASVGAEERLVELGPTKAQRDSSANVLDFPFIARADEQLTGARVRLVLEGPGRDTPRVEGLEVLVNDEPLALLLAEEIAGGDRVRDLRVQRELLADRNTLSLRLRDREGRCTAQDGAWRAVRSVGVALQTAPVPLPNELALLPIPFFDRGFDTKATVPVVLARAPSHDETRLLALVASWFAVDAPLPLGFAAHVGALPDSRAVVLLAGEADAARLGLEPPDGPSVRMIDHPRHPESNVKLLVVGGRDAAELRTAVESLAARGERLVGQQVRLRPPPEQPPAPPYSAPRWVPSGRPMRFSEYPEGGVLAHEGSRPATLSVRFRVAPDLWIWPSESVLLDLGWTERLPPGATAPRLDVEMNGYFLATLPHPRGSGEVAGRARLRIPREHMRGFNQLLVHVHYPEPDPCGAAATGGGRIEQPRIAIAGDSALHLEGLSHFASLPDVSLFAYDGFPFTRVPDLADTVVVLPDAPAPAELSAVLSIFAQLAQVTGRVGTRAAFIAASRAGDADLRDKDLLVVGGAQDNALVSRWAARLPLTLNGPGPRAQRAWTAASLLELLGGVGPLIDLRRAGSILERTREVSALAAIESPVSRGRTAVFVTGTSPSRLPPYDEFLGYAESRTRNADLLLLADGQRWLFRVGTSYGRGELDAWTRVRWFLATHWMALLPVLVLGVFILAHEARRFLARRIRERLAAGGPA